MQLKLSDLEIEVLRKLVNGEAVSLSSQLRLRLEMAGVLRDGARGIIVTDAGRRLSSQKPAEVAVGSAAPDPAAPDPSAGSQGRPRWPRPANALSAQVHLLATCRLQLASASGAYVCDRRDGCETERMTWLAGLSSRSP
jgi:hypothetical protein